MALAISLVAGMRTALALPVITAVEPLSGAPGTSVAITGSGLADAFDVQFGMAPALFTIVSDRRITTTVPLDATTGPVSIHAVSGFVSTLGEFRVAPLITELVPPNGPPGARILILGFNFEPDAEVRFNGTNASFSVPSPTQIEATVPGGATNGPVTVTTELGEAISPEDFIVTGKGPFIQSFSPTRGEPNQTVTVQGLNLLTVDEVKFNDLKAQFRAVSDTQISATVPSGASSGPIRLTNEFGAAISLQPFIVTSAPVVESFHPLAGAPGTDVTVEGANFIAPVTVKFGGKQATSASVVAATQLHATVPPGATNGPISVTTAKGTGISATDFIASAGPVVVDVSPSSGLPRTLIAISGINFTDATVKLNGVSAKASAVSTTQISMEVPANATSGPITVTTPKGSFTTAQIFLVRTGKPIITGFTPAAGQGRTSVLIEGVDFSGAFEVRFNGARAPVSTLADTLIGTEVPDGATSGRISVTTPRGTGTSSNRFVVAPGIQSFNPTNGVAGKTVSIRGTNLEDVAWVRFKDALAEFEHVGTNELVAAVPEEATTGSINLIGPAGIVATTAFFSVLPQVNRFTPTSGMAGTKVTIFGTGYSDVQSVRFGNVNATFKVVSATEIEATVPSGATTGPITVTTASGSATSARSFTVGVTADLALTQTQSTNLALQNQVLTYSIEVTNQGPSSASGVILSNRLPANVLISSMVASHGKVSNTGEQVRVDVGSLAIGGKASLTLTVLPTTAGILTNTASVAARETDPDPADNTSSLVATVVASAASLRIDQIAGGNITFSWPVAATNFVPQFTAGIGSKTWQPLTTAPVVKGDRNSVTVPIAGTTRFYRLVRP